MVNAPCSSRPFSQLGRGHPFYTPPHSVFRFCRLRCPPFGASVWWPPLPQIFSRTALQLSPFNRHLRFIEHSMSEGGQKNTLSSTVTHWVGLSRWSLWSTMAYSRKSILLYFWSVSLLFVPKVIFQRILLEKTEIINSLYQYRLFSHRTVQSFRNTALKDMWYKHAYICENRADWRWNKRDLPETEDRRGQ